jgi:hypothetical protein
MNLYNELDLTYSNTNNTFSSFTHRILPNNTINYYLNDDKGISIYDQDWNFIRRIDLHSLNPDISLRGNIFIYDEFIYIGNVYDIGHYMFLKVDFNLHIINLVHLPRSIPSMFDYCNKRILLLRIGGLSKINIDVYDLNLRKLSEINCTSINSAYDTNGYWLTNAGLGLFNNQLYISYNDENNILIIFVTDLNGQYITKHVLIKSRYYDLLNPLTFDHFGNILFTIEGQLCLFSTVLNKIRKCILIFIDHSPTWEYYRLPYEIPLYAQVDLSGRLVVIDSINKKMQFYGPFETKSKIFIFY